MLDLLLDSVLDCLKLIPFLYLSYLFVEYAEHKMGEKTKQMIYRSGKFGPAIGALAGLLPQCGFSAAAAGLFAPGVITPGTLIAVFLATSDEMLPIMISKQIAPGIIGRILMVKLVAAVVTGFAVDFVAGKFFGYKHHMELHPEICVEEHCGCEEHSIWYSAWSHTAQTTIFIFILTFLLGIWMEWFGGGATRLFSNIPGAQQALAALIGMIPNCAASVLITELYLQGILKAGAMFSGLLCGAGTGLLVLFRENKNKKVCFMIIIILYLSGLFMGTLAGVLRIL